MLHRRSPLALILTLVLPLAVMAAIPAEQVDGNASPVVIATMETLPAPIRSKAPPSGWVVLAIIRTPDEPDLILLKERHATPPVLADALDDLRESRTQMRTPDQGYVRIVTHGGAPGAPGEVSGGAPELAMALRDVRAAPLKPLRNLGDAHWLEFTAEDLGL